MLRIKNNQENALVVTLSELRVNESNEYVFEFKHVQTQEVTAIEIVTNETNSRFDEVIIDAEFEHLGDYEYKVMQEETIIEQGLAIVYE